MVLRGVGRGLAHGRRTEAAQFEEFGLQWRSMPRMGRIKKALFLASTSATIAYYAFLGVLLLVR